MIRLSIKSLLPLLLLVALLPAPSVLMAEEDKAEETSPAAADPLEQKIYDVIRDIARIQEQVPELRRKYRNSQGEEHSVAWMQLIQFESDADELMGKLVSLFTDMKEKSLDVSLVEPLVVQLLMEETDRLVFDIGELRERLNKLVDERKQAEAADRSAITQEIKESVSNLNNMIGALFNNAKRKEALGLQVAGDLQQLDSILDEWAGELAAHLELVHKEELALQERFDTAEESEKADLAAQLKAVKARMETVTSSLGVMIGLMKQRDLETSDYSKLLITSTGQITQEIFQKEVAVGLLSDWAVKAQEWLLENGMSLLFEVVVVILILIAFRFFAVIVGKFVARAVNNSRLDVSNLLKDFAISTSRKAVMLFGILVALSQMGIDVGPMLAGLGVAGFIVGFALKDTLSNFASGLMILIYRPFDVGDAVEVDGVAGKVKQMTLVSTTVLTFDNQQLMIPNNNIWGNTIKNITARKSRRVDMTFGIGYADDIARAETILWKIVKDHPLVLTDPEPVIRLSALGASSVDFIVRPWSKTSDYWEVYWDITRSVKEAFDKEGISIPFPQTDVHLYRHDAPESAPRPGKE